MKHFLLLLLAALSLISCSDDSNPVTPAASITVYSPKKVTVYTTSNGTKVYNFTHDSRGNVLTENCDSVSRKTYTYDARGNLLTISNKSFIANKWVLQDSTLSEYDQNNNITTKTEIINLNGIIDYSKRYHYGYDSEGKMISSNVDKYQNSSWNAFVRSTYSYNSQKKLSTVLAEINSNGIWCNSSLLTYSYSPAGDLLYCLYDYNSPENIWVDIKKIEYKYDTEQNIVETTVKVCENNNWYHDAKSEYQYDSNKVVVRIDNYTTASKVIWQLGNNDLELSTKNNKFKYYGYKMTVEYASFQVPATNPSSAAPAVSLPELVPDEMIERLAPYNNHKRN